MHSLGTTLPAALKSRGVSRREFAQFYSSMVAMLALPPRYLGAVMQALAQANRPVLDWFEFQNCAGNSESMLRSDSPPSRRICSRSTILEIPRTPHGWCGDAGGGCSRARCPRARR
jgi:hydrogenase small subunit